jgi:hypothetical protein
MPRGRDTGICEKWISAQSNGHQYKLLALTRDTVTTNMNGKLPLSKNIRPSI